MLFAAVPLVLLGSGPTLAAPLSKAVPPDASDAKSPSLAASSRLMSPGLRAEDAAFSKVRLSSAIPPEISEEITEMAQTVIAAPASRITSERAKATPLIAAAVEEMSEHEDDQAAPVRVAKASSSVDSDVRCVAQAVFHEARGESLQGQKAVADVVMNRKRSGRWGSSACAVVNAPKQFSNRWSWRTPQMGVAAWDKAIEIARNAVSGVVGVSSRLMNFRASYMGSGGSKPLRIGNHIFW